MLPDGFRQLFRLPSNRARVAREVDDEIAFHLAMREEKLRAAGLADAEARAAARRRFGDVHRVADECLAIDVGTERARSRTELLESVGQDLRYAARTLRRTPGFTAAAVLTLALGIGATTAIFSVAYGVLVRPLGYAEPERIVQLWETSTRTPGDRNPLSIPNYRDFAAQSRSFDAIGAYAFNRFTLAGDRALPEQVQGAQLLGDVFRVLGVRPLLGRTLGPDAERVNVVVLSEALWRRRFGADRAVLGRAVRMNGEPYTVVGVMPASFRFPSDDVELWTGYATILADATVATARGRRFQRAVARLRPGVTAAAAGRELNAIAGRLAAQFPDDDAGGGAMVVPLREQLVGDVRPALRVLVGAVGCVLLIACANVAHLLLARTAVRERELALRVALGAGRRRVARQLLTESAALALVGGALGVALAYAAVTALVRLAPDALPRLADVRVDVRALAFATAASLATGLAAGLAPALRGARRGLALAARQGGGAGGVRGQRAHGALVTAEVAAALVLLVGAGLLMRSFQRLRTVDPGASPAGVATMLVVPGLAKYQTPAHQRAVFERLVEGVAAVPGVLAVGLCDCQPPDHARTYTAFLVEGGATEMAALPNTDQIRVGANYFGALRIPVLAGRAFTGADRDGSLPVAVVSEALARRHLAAGAASADPRAALAAAVGRRVSFDGENWLTVVGVVGDVRYDGIAGEVQPALYLPFAQDPFPGMYMFVRAAGDPLAVVPAVQRAVLAVDPELPLARVTTLAKLVSDSVARPRFNAVLLAVFAGLAFALAAVGVYGVVSYAVAQRTREVGIRLALGAHPGDVLRLTLWRGLRPVLAGVGLGVAGAAAASRLLAHLLYDTSPHDPGTYLALAALLTVVAAVACFLPARRATLVDPMSALRSD